MDAARRRQGRAACRGGAAQLEGAALDRHPAAEGVMFMRLPSIGCEACLAPTINEGPGIFARLGWFVHLETLFSFSFRPLAPFAEVGFVCGKLREMVVQIPS